MDLSAFLQQQGGAGGFGGFGGAAAGGGTLVEVRAGLLNRNGTTVTADKRKGMVRIFKGQDQILHFAWKERAKPENELDLMLFPGDAEAFMLPQPPATGRCFALRFKTSQGIHFFWLQDPKAEKDEQLMKDINTHLGNAPAESTPAASGASDQMPPPAGDDDEAAALEAALAMSMEGASEGVETPSAAPPAATPSAPPKGGTQAVSPGDDEEAAALKAALAMSMGGEGAEDDEAAALEAALAMSMEAGGGDEAKKDDDDDDADLYD